MAARRMAQRNHASEIQLEVHREQSKMISAPGDILQGSGPTAAGVSNPPVLDTPRCQTCVGQRRAKVTDIFQVIQGAPESAMDNNDDGMQSCIPGKAEIPEL